MAIKINRAQCKHCGEIIESTHRHDFVQCSCCEDEEYPHGIFVDGGQCYLRRGWRKESEFIELSEFEDE